MMYHLAQFQTSSLFPRTRGLVSGAFVAGFVGSGVSFFVLRAVINALGGSHAAYRSVARCAVLPPHAARMKRGLVGAADTRTGAAAGRLSQGARIWRTCCRVPC